MMGSAMYSEVFSMFSALRFETGFSLGPFIKRHVI